MDVNVDIAVYIEIGGRFLIYMLIIAILALPCWHCWHCYLCDVFYLRKPSSSAADGAVGGRSEGSRKGFKQNKGFIFKKIIHTKHISVHLQLDMSPASSMQRLMEGYLLNI